MLVEDAKRLGLWDDPKKPVKGKEHARIEGGKLVVHDDSVVEPVIDTSDSDDAVIAKVDLDDIKMDELKKMAVNMGIEIPRWCKKAKLIKLIKKSQG